MGTGGLRTDMPQQQFVKTLRENIQAIPGAIGVNNHMGSLLTENHEKMNWLMAELKLRELFFVDSRTTSKSIAQEIAQHWQIPAIGRKVFLDHEDDPKAIATQFERLIKLAKKHGHAIAIAHPRKNTLSFLEQNLQRLAASGVSLISPSDIIRLKFPEKRLKNHLSNLWRNDKFLCISPFLTK